MDINLKGLPGGDGPVELPIPVQTAFQDPEKYVASDGLIAAAETALMLGQPLLLTGEPGCGKSSFADFLRHKLGRTRQLRAFGRSNMEVGDLFYTYDEIGRYQEGSGSNKTQFLTLEGLGEAVLRASVPDETAGLRDALLEDDKMAQTREVVLIDEIDKAPRDVPNDLLAMLSGGALTLPVPELGRGGARVEIVAPLAKMPVMVITSNSEKSLPEPFLRRCAYFHIEFPDDDDVARIIDHRIHGAPADSALVASAIELVRRIRGRRPNKLPSLAELIGFVQIMLERGYSVDRPIEGNAWKADAKATLLKVKEDRDHADDLLA